MGAGDREIVHDESSTTRSSSSSSNSNNSSGYRSMFTDVVRKHAGSIRARYESLNDESSSTTSSSSSSSSSSYRAETAVLRRAVAVETETVAIGVVVGIVAFASLRYGPDAIARRLDASRAEASLRARRRDRGTAAGRARGALALAVEVLFGTWAGVVGRRAASRVVDDGDVDLARLPLVEGRSAVAEAACAEWIDAAYRRIPRSFWGRVRDGTVDDPRSWETIADFAENCRRRTSYVEERRRRRRRGDGAASTVDGDDADFVPSPGVPEEFPIPLLWTPTSNEDDEDDDETSSSSIITNTRAEELVKDR